MRIKKTFVEKQKTEGHHVELLIKIYLREFFFFFKLSVESSYQLPFVNCDGFSIRVCFNSSVFFFLKPLNRFAIDT